MKNYQSVNKCRLCGSDKFHKIVSLGKQSLSSIFPKNKKKNPIKSPLELIKCKNLDHSCGLVQLKHSANIQKMYGTTYGYHSSISPLMLNHLKKKADYLKKNFKISKKDNILDIGCNDGSFLNFFKNKRAKRFGIDPSSKKFKKNFDNDIKLAIDFFSKEKIIKYFGYKKFKIISSIAMFYDIENPRDFCRDINDLLTDDGIWAVELSYMPLMLKNLTYDQICHEHVTYWGVREFDYLASISGLKIVDVQFNEINGGSFYLLLSKKDSIVKEKKRKIYKILKEENKLKYIKPFINFKKRIINHKKELNNFLFKMKKQKKKVLGYGASTKGNIVLNFCGIKANFLDSICDHQKEKVGLYTPGSNIKIISKKEMRLKKPDYILVLIWPFRAEVLRQEKELIKKGGKAVFSLPRFHVVNKKNYRKYIKSSFSKMSFKY